MIGTQNAVLTEETENTPQTNIYPELRQLIKEQGLLKRQPLYYTYKIISTLSLLALSITFLVIVDNPWLQLANAAFLAFVYSQSGYVGHDAGHRAVLRSLRGNEIIGLSVSFLLGMSRTWWVRQHNQHHSSPNDLKSDPHTMLSPFSFSQELALSRSRLMRFAVGYQAFYFVPTLLLEGMAIRLASFQYLWARRNTKYARIEFFLMGLHFHLYFGLLFYFLDPWQVLGFFLIHQGLFGLYYGTVFAPNHKGMLILDNEKPLDFLRTQVLTTRNVKPGPIADFWYGGLNYQIEHHLFPMMPRNNFGKARKIIKAFCLKYNVPYYETSTLRSYREILSYLHQVGAPVRSWPRLKKQLEPGQ